MVGNWEFCGPFWEYLKTKKNIKNEVFASKEILYSLELKNQNLLFQSDVRLLTESDYDQWRPLRLDYLIEEGVPNDLNKTKSFFYLFHMSL